MPSFKVRVQTLGALGFLTQADHYEDHTIESDESIEALAARLATKGFLDETHRDPRWIMPGSIYWIEEKK